MLTHSLSLAIAALRDRKGVTAAEYAILAAAIVIAVGAAVTAFSTNLTAKFTALLGA